MGDTNLTAPAFDQAAVDARLAAIVDSSDDAILSKSLDGVILTWNKGAERIFGYTEAEAIGRPILMLLPEDRHSEETEILRRVRGGERVEHYETVRQHKDGHPVNVSVTVSPIKNSFGHVIGASKVARLIDERLAAEIARAHLAAIVESSDDAIVSKTLDGIVRSWNRGAENLFGYTAEEMIGKPITAILPEERLDEENMILSRLRAGGKVDHFETIRRRKDGTLVEVSVTISPIRNVAGEVVGASKVARDIGERKAAQRALNQMNEELELRVRERTELLESANREMEGFTYSVSHDLRGPLRGLIASSMILKEDFGDQLPEEAKQLIERQVYSANRLALLIDDLLKLSRIGRASLKAAQVDLSKLAREVFDECCLTYPAAQATIQPGLEATGDQDLLKLLLLNLIGNACKFSPEGARIEIGKEGDEFFVRDAGIGFDMQYRDKLFIPFERLVRDDQFPGTGIGLANAKRVVERHGGQLRAEGEVGRGATFYFTLPM